MIKLNGTFDLRDSTERTYAEAFDRFCVHLASLGFVVNWSIARRLAHDGYDRNPPQTRYAVQMEFPDMERAEACFDYVAKNEEPIQSLHRTMNSLVDPETTAFFLTETLS